MLTGQLQGWLRALWARDPGARADAGKLLRAGRFVEAERAFAQRAQERPRDAAPRVALGQLALLRDDVAAAEVHLTEAVRLKPRHGEAQGLLAEAHYRRDDFGAAALASAAAGQRTQAAKLRSFEGRKPYSLAGPQVVRLPFVRREPLPVIEARVNGGTQARFLLDTGGGELILDTEFARKNEARTFGRESGRFAGGRRAAVEHGAVDLLTLGDLSVRDVPVQIMDVSAMGAALGEAELAGIIGTVLFYRLCATLDYPGEQLVLRPKDSLADERETGMAVPFRMAGDHYMLAEGTLNDGEPLLFLVDTGLGGGAFTCPPSTLQAAGIDLRRAPSFSGAGAGGSVQVRPFEIAALSLGPARQEGLTGIAGAFPPQLEWAFGFRIGGLVSHQFLLPYAVTFDFARMVLRLVRRS